MATKQKFVRPVVDGTPWSSAVKVKNSTGSAIPAETMVYFSGNVGKTPTVAVANASTSDEPERTLWVTRHAIPDGKMGHVLPWSLVTTSFTGTPGLPIYLKDDGTYTHNLNNSTKAGIVVGEIVSTTHALIAPALSRGALSGPRAEAVTGAGGTVVSPTKTLVPRDSGTTYYITLSGDAVFKLPAAALGLEYEFIIQTTGTDYDFCLITAATTSDFVGFTRQGSSSTVAAIAASKSTIQMNGDAATTTVGDYIRVKCDGTHWHVDCQTVAASLIFNNGHVL